MVGSVDGEELLLSDAFAVLAVHAAKVFPERLDEDILLILGQVECTEPSFCLEVEVPFVLILSSSELRSVNFAIVIRIKQIPILEPLWIRLFKKHCRRCSHEGGKH